MKFLPLVWAGLKRKKLRTTLTFLSIFVAFMLFAFLGALKVALGGGVEMAGQDRLITRHKVSLIQTLPESYKSRIQSVKGVGAVCHQTWFGGLYQDDPKNFFASMPVEPESFLDMFPEFVLKDSEKQAWLATRTGAIVGHMIAERFKWKIGDRIPIKSPIWGQPAGMGQWEFEVVGIFDAKKKGGDTSSLYFRYDYFEEARQKALAELKPRSRWVRTPFLPLTAAAAAAVVAALLVPARLRLLRTKPLPRSWFGLLAPPASVWPG